MTWTSKVEIRAVSVQTVNKPWLRIVRWEFDGVTTAIANYHEDDLREMLLMLELAARHIPETEVKS